MSSGGRCSFSKKPHVQLRGWIGSRWATSVAEPYPKSLCQRLALELVQAVKKRKWHHLCELVWGRLDASSCFGALWMYFNADLPWTLFPGTRPSAAEVRQLATET